MYALKNFMMPNEYFKKFFRKSWHSVLRDSNAKTWKISNGISADIDMGD